MGLYDYINGEQVKCFYRPVYSEGEGIWHSGGYMLGYVNGETVPVKTIYYKYPTNFIIFDELLNERSAIIHIIKESKVLKTVSLDSFKDEDFESIDGIFDYYGVELNLKNKQDMIDYIDAHNNHIDFINKTRATADKLFDKFLSYHSLDKKIDRLKKFNKLNKIFDYLSLFNDNDTNFKTKFLNILSKYNIKDLSDENKDLLVKNENFINDFSKLLIEESAIKLEIFNNKHSKEKERISKILKPKIKEFNNRWLIKDKYALEKSFGEYLDVIMILFETRNDKDILTMDNKKIYLDCKQKFIDFINENEGIKEKYIKWGEFTKEEEEEIDEILKMCVYND